MKERPILFSAEMVRAILEGRKTQTRRVMKSQPYSNGFHWNGNDILCHNDYLPPSAMLLDVGTRKNPCVISSVEDRFEYNCPYGQPGDRLWVRETWAARPCQDHLSPSQCDDEGLWWKASISPFPTGLAGCHGKWRPSIHMPRWASRILLEITDIRVERLQDICEDDAKGEGYPVLQEENVPHPKNWFELLWDSINAKRGFGWDSNPWVWVIEFKRLEGE